jgi:transcriptional regulator with XRE-family HTH domain
MWRDNFLRLFKESNLSTKQLADKCFVSENTIKRIIKYPDATTQLVTLERLATGLGYKLEDITNDTNTIVGSINLDTLQKKCEELQRQLEDTQKERDILLTDNALLKTETNTLASRIELLELKLAYTEKLLAVYEKYNNH